MSDSVQPFVRESAVAEDDDVVELSDWIPGVPGVDSRSHYMYKVLESALGVHYMVVSRDQLVALGLLTNECQMEE